MSRIQAQARKMKTREVLLTPNEGTILYLRNHPVFAAKYLLNVRLNWIQRLAIKAIWDKQFIMLTLGRRCGKSFLGAIVCILRSMLFPGEKCLIAGPSKRQVDWIFLNEILPLYQSSDYFKASVVGKVTISNAYNRIKFTNGSIVEGVPVGNDGGKIRGASANLLWIDEYAQMDETIIKLVFKPMMLVKKLGRDNRYLITSSAYYRWNHLWPLFQYYTVKQVIEPLKYYVGNYNYKHLLLSKRLPVEFDMNIIEDAKNTLTEAEFSMEYLSVYPEDIEGFFSAKLIEHCTPRPPREIPVELELIGDGKSNYYMGIDVGRAEGGSNFAISIIKKQAKYAKLVYVITANGATYQQMVELIRRKFIDFNVCKIMMDAGGGGLTIKDLLREKWEDHIKHVTMRPIVDMEDAIDGIRVLEMVNINDEVHNMLHTNLKSEMEHRRLLLPIDIRRDLNKEIERAGQEMVQFKTELQVMTAKPKGKYLRFEVPEKFRTDRVIATGLCISGYLQDRFAVYEDTEMTTGMWV